VSDYSSDYIQDNFEPDDRLAVVLINKSRSSVIQRINAAQDIAAPEFQDWLSQRNGEGYDVYISMNALRADATGRTKPDVATIRHIYLDFDDDGTTAVEKLRARADIPLANYVLQTSPGKYQIIWKVDGFTKDQAEHLQRSLAQDAVADPAATDCARVLRIPGFRNFKYANRPIVTFGTQGSEIYRPEHFPSFPAKSMRCATAHTNLSRQNHIRGSITQSERDWAYAKRALRRGERPELVIAAIANYRRYDKHAPHYYAELTVRKAAEAVRSEKSEDRIQQLDR
jgi:hypothetical protein